MTDFANLIQQLFDADYNTHTRATIALYDEGKRAVPHLLTALDTASNNDAQRRVIALLGELQDRRATDKLCQLLLAPTTTDDSKLTIIVALGHLDDIRSLPAIATRLSDSNRIATRAATVLGHYGLRQAIPHLQAQLSHKDAAVRLEAAAVLGQTFRDPVAVAVLLPALNADTSDTEHLRALEVLGNMQAEAALGRMLDSFMHPNAAIQTAAATALGKIGDKAALDVLLRRLKADIPPHLRTAIITAIGNIGEPSATLPLLELLERTLTVAERRALAAAFGKIGDPMSIDALRELIAFDVDYNVQYQAVIALADIAHPIGIDILRDLLVHDNPLMRQAGITAIGLVRDHSQADKVAAFLDVADMATVHAAAVALMRLNRSHVEPAYQRLLTDLFHGDYEVCWFTLHTLESFPDSRFTKPLIAALDDDDTSTREMAIGILGDIGDPQAISHLVPLLRSKWALRRKARLALLKLGYTFENEWPA